MRIAFLLPGRGFSGGIRAGVRLASEFRCRGHEVSVFFRKEPTSVKTLLRCAYRKLALRVPKDWLYHFKGTWKGFGELTPGLVGDCDFVVAIGPDCVVEMQKLPEKCGRKVFNVHGLTLRNPAMREQVWLSSNNIPKIVVSDYVRTSMLSEGIDNIVAVVPNGVDASEYFSEKSIFERNVVGTVYGDGFAKAPDTIIGVFEHLHRLRPALPLLCFGGCRRPKNLSGVVEYTRLPDVIEARRLYSRCAVWFCASRSEGFGLPILEAMACGCAVVSRDCGGPRDFLKSGINGIITTAEKPVEIAGEILKVLENSSLRDKLTGEGMKTAKMMSWSSAAAQMEQVLKELAVGSRTT